MLNLLLVVALALVIQGPDEEDLADDTTRMSEQAQLFEHFDGDYEAFQTEVAQLNDQYETKKRDRFEERNGGSENFIHSWEEEGQ